ncbi:MAG: hypothetical protein A2802_00385 [Candidatus Woykebacteria bacterium RIFCSPHIGHO2_01_FULL_43_29]|nr:MAG: hypothetical protein A2802_00385 [Candidatus Woykebacteria bacterium RIFCSPHIGHO2_01_FULL_43_29]
MTSYDPNYKPKRVYFLVGQKALLTRNNKLLLIKRSDKCSNPGTWSLPGGALEKDETPESGIKREIKEETGLSINNLKLIHTVALNEKEAFSDKPALLLVWAGRAKTEDVQLNWEHDQFKWVTKQEALKEESLTKFNREFISKL